MRPFLLLALLLLGGCRARAAELRVFAASSLTNALTEIGAAYEKRSGRKVVFNFGASGTLARQIAEGAPADLFLSADEEKMNELARRNLVRESTRVSVLSNTLVVVVPRQEGRTIAGPRQLADPSVRSIAMGDPAIVPAGIYARRWLERTGLWTAVAPKVIPVANVRAALSAVAAGNADAAIVYRTDAQISSEVRVTLAVSGGAGPRISYPFAVLTGAEDAAAALRFLQYLQSKPALDVFARHGFVIDDRR